MRKLILDGVTVIAALSALGIAWLALQRQNVPMESERQPREIDDWVTVSSGGRQVGGNAGTVRLVAFIDYQCPACRMYERWFRGLRSEFRNELALVYRHYPLSYHHAAYSAARAVECAADQNRFEDMHAMLMSEESWMLNANREFERMARDAGIPDLATYQRCIEGRNPVPSIQRDLRVGRKIGVSGTPTLVLNGVMLGTVDSVGLADAVREALSEEAQ